VLSSNIKYASLSPAVHEVVDAICKTHNDLRKRQEYFFLTRSAEENGLGRVGLKEYLSNLKCAVFNSVSRIEASDIASANARIFIDDAKVGLDYISMVNRLALLDAEERTIVDSEEVLPFYIS
jgi:hypothetical protein